MKEKLYRHLDAKDRIQLEVLVKAGHTKREMAALLGVHLSTVYRELRRGRCRLLDSQYRWYDGYSAEVAKQDYAWKVSSRGAPLKLGGNYALADYIEHKIIDEKYSPAALAADLRGSGLGYLCRDTIYRYIHAGVFERVTVSHLPERGRRKKPHEHVQHENKVKLGTSIEQRPQHILSREEFGHWEGDLVIGQAKTQGQCFFVLTERKTRAELIFKLNSKRSSSVVRVLDRLQSNCDFRHIFKSITFDNGPEFSDSWGMEHSPRGRRRTRVYYCHPYTSCERGSNENANRLIRRWYPKGTSLAPVKPSDCVSLARWMNTYPRAILGWKTASQAFLDACTEDGIKISPYLSQYLS